MTIGETEMEDEFDTYSNTIWIDMPMFSRVMHVLKQVDFRRCSYPRFILQ